MITKAGRKEGGRLEGAKAMEVDVSKRNMKQIEENVRQTVIDFGKREDIKTRFGEPVIAFLSTTHPLFDTFFARGENDHPKNIYRPGNTLILHYVPWEEGVEKSNEASDKDGEDPKEAGGDAGCGEDKKRPSPQWLAADRESLWLAMEINKTIKKTLDKVGRIHSNTSSMVDWDKNKHRYGWSNRIAGFIAGLGELGPAGSLHVDLGGLDYGADAGKVRDGRRTYGGRIGSISTAALYAEKSEDMGSEELERIFSEAMKACCFKGWGATCPKEMIDACPAGAIDSDGIDRQKCQDWCETIDAHTPAPEICGKCFRFK